MTAKGFLFLVSFGLISSKCSISNKLDSSTNGKAYLALGDSYTIGESVPESENFPFQLVEELKEKQSYSTPKIIARTGWRTDELISEIEKEGISTKYDLVSLLIGVNDEFQGGSIKSYESNFIKLCLMAIDACKSRDGVVILSIPDYGFTPYGRSRQSSVSKRIDLFNASNKRIADSLGLRYVDVTPISREGFNRTNLVASDGLHPSGDQYKEWAAEVIRNLEVRF